jgi:hypothetical protein
LGGGALLAACGLFLLALTPLILFNAQTGGTLAALGANAQQSYYGVDNADLAANLPVRWSQVLQVLRGEQFWYLGALLANPLAPWLALLLLLAGLLRDWRLLLAPLLLTVGVFAASLFTISDLFVTHYVLLQPLLVTLAALGAAAWLEEPPVRAGLTRRGVSAMTPVLAGLLAIWLSSTWAIRSATTARWRKAAGWPTTATPAITWPITCSSMAWGRRWR